MGRFVLRFPLFGDVLLHQLSNHPVIHRGQRLWQRRGGRLGARHGLHHRIAKLLGQKGLPPRPAQNFGQHGLGVGNGPGQPIGQRMGIFPRKACELKGATNVEGGAIAIVNQVYGGSHSQQHHGQPLIGGIVGPVVIAGSNEGKEIVAFNLFEAQDGVNFVDKNDDGGGDAF